jgi:dihydrofolate synthase/folylpolyglutamate synthase
MIYNQAIEWINSFEKFGIKLSLDRISYISKKLKNPHKDYPIIHVAGTNGKGSVCRFMQSILSAEGYKTGLYTSPHLQTFSERITINDKQITKKEIVDLVTKLKPIVQKMKDPPTYFEIVTAMAFLYFSDEKVDYAIIEVGLGGRFDATNIVSPILTIITNVSLDHQDRLGKTIKKIAFEKAGIIKEKVPIITAAEKRALEVIKDISDKKDTQLLVIDKTNYRRISGSFDWQEYKIKGQLKQYSVITHLPGIFQGMNIALAINAIEQLQMNGVFISEKSINIGIENTKNPGRMEIVSTEPIILLDGAHNITGIKALEQTIKKDFVYDKLILIIGILADKNIKKMLKEIIPIADEIIVTQSKNKRAMDAEKLNDLIKNKKSIFKKEISEAIKYSKEIAKKNDLICITGSLFTVGEAKNHLII